MSKRFLGVLIAAVVMTAAAGGLIAQIEKPAKQDRKSFGKDKILVVDAGADLTATLADVEIQKVGERTFLVGTEVKSEFVEVFAEGATTWIPFEDVKRIVDVTGLTNGKKHQAKAAAPR